MKERLAKFLPMCNQITEQLFLGSEKVAANKALLQENKITHILNCAGTICLEYFPEDFTYKYLSLVDGKAEDVTCLLYDVLDWFEAILANPQHRIFVHCQQGISRSSTMLIAYLMWLQKRPFNDVLLQVKAIRDICNPNQNFQCQLMDFLWKRIAASATTSSSSTSSSSSTTTTTTTTSSSSSTSSSTSSSSLGTITRCYRVQPHTVYSPELIVCKEIPVSATTAPPLDPRGAFLFTSARGCSIWIGKDCPSVLTEGAMTWAHRFEKYEKIPQKVRVVHQDNVAEDFWSHLNIKAPSTIEPLAGNDHTYQVVLPLTLSGQSMRDEYRRMLREQLLSSGEDPTKNDALNFDQAGPLLAAPSSSKKVSAQLYQSPDWSSLGTFDIDDLDSDELYALVVDSQPAKVYIWVGSSYSSKISRSKAKSLAKDCLSKHAISTHDIKVHLVKDGKEDDDFWKYF